MGNFQGGGSRGGSGGGFRGGNGGGNRGGGGGYRGGGDRAEVTMHKATCDECHKSCEVPFRPSSDKPVYCNDCFASKRKDDDRAPRRDFGDRGPRKDFNASPAQSSFAKSAVAQGDMSKQLGDINAKLDRLVSAIEKLTQPAVKVAKVVEVVTKKTVVAKATAKKVVAKKKK